MGWSGFGKSSMQAFSDREGCSGQLQSHIVCESTTPRGQPYRGWRTNHHVSFASRLRSYSVKKFLLIKSSEHIKKLCFDPQQDLKILENSTFNIDRKIHGFRKKFVPIAIEASEVPLRTKRSAYPEPFASRVTGRSKRQLGDFFGLKNFGVYMTRLEPNSVSSLRHAHTLQDEFIFILSGHPTLVTDEGLTMLRPSLCAGFPAGIGNGHRLVKESDEEILFLEIGDRSPSDGASYPDEDLVAALEARKWCFCTEMAFPIQLIITNSEENLLQAF